MAVYCAVDGLLEGGGGLESVGLDGGEGVGEREGDHSAGNEGEAEEEIFETGC